MKNSPIGLSHWMERVLDEVDGARRELAVDRVHDLRVALRRCLSMAERFMAIDPDKTWKAMKKECRQLFRCLGRLRDIQVLEEWVNRLGTAVDSVSIAMLHHLGQSEQGLKSGAVDALKAFNDAKWRRWMDRLETRARCLPLGGEVFQLNALQAWTEARELHKQALRNRSAAAYHRLRIGIKRLRYTVENFLPLQYAEWGRDLKELQDCLGEMHDLFIFWQTALKLRAFPDPESRECWRALITDEEAKRLNHYREKMMGSGALWGVWRQGLPPQNRLHALSLRMVEKWAALHGINLDRARRVRHLALQLFDGLRTGRRTAGADVGSRAVLHLAAILHELPRPKSRKGGGKSAAKLLLELPPTPGFTAESLLCAAIVIRGHRVKFLDREDEDYAALPEEQHRPVMELCGILRLARVLARFKPQAIESIEVKQERDAIVVIAPGFSEFGPWAEKAARERYLLESACQRPVIIRSGPGRKDEAIPVSLVDDEQQNDGTAKLPVVRPGPDDRN